MCHKLRQSPNPHGNTDLPSLNPGSREGPQNCRSLAFARDDKKESVVAGKGRLPDETVVAEQRNFSNLIWTGLDGLAPGFLLEGK
jgi:hypothetical protein